MKRLVLFFSLLFSISFYGQNDTLSVVRHTDNDFVIPKDLKVVFRGIKNELFIDVPNAKSFEISGNNLIKKDKNTYDFNPGAGLETILTIDIVLKNNKKITEKHVFKIRNVARIISTFNKIEGNPLIKLQKSAFKDGVVDAMIGDKNIRKIFEVKQFTIKIPGIGAFVIQGNKIDNNTFEKINKQVSRGDMITIFDIKTKSSISSSSTIFEVLPLVIEIL